METASNHADLRRETAVVLHALGAAIIPLNGKRPTNAGWQNATHSETCDEAVAHAEQGNIGMVCGEASGIDVIDLDGEDPDQQKRDLGIADIATWEVLTGSGKRHLYFAHQPGMSNKVRVLGDAIDIRTTGGQVVLPGSVHPDTGRAYDWAPGRSPADAPLAPWPPHLLERLMSKAPAKAGAAEDCTEKLPPDVRAQVKAQVAAEVADAVTRLMGTPEGKRNDTLNILAHALFLKANSGFADADEVEELLRDAALKAGLESDEIRSTLASARSGADGKGLPASDRSVLVWAAGRDARRKPQLVEAPPAEARQRLYSISSAILDHRCTAVPLVKGLIYQRELVVPYGAPGSGKTFVVLSLALALAAGAPTWAGRKATGCQVVYVAGEGTRGIRNRIRAWARQQPSGERKALDALTDRLWIREGAPQFLDDASWQAFRDELLEAVPNPRLVVFDTLSRCLAGKDENAAQDMTQAVGRADELRQLAGAAVFLVHHTGKDGQKERGSSALRGAADVMFKVERDDSRDIAVDFDKLKEADLPDEPLLFRLRRVELGVDEDRDPVWSAIVEFVEPRRGGLSAADLRAMRALAQTEAGEALTLAEWGKRARLPKTSMQRAKDVLIQKGYVFISGSRGNIARYAAHESGREAVRHSA